MATQAVLIAETIAGMKKAITRNQYCPYMYCTPRALQMLIVTPPIASDSDDSITKPSNRGNKLKRKAQYVHEGQLDLPNGPRVYKRVSLSCVNLSAGTRRGPELILTPTSRESNMLAITDI